MSDGDNATPGPSDPAGGDDNRWLTRSQRRAPGAAPWERAEFPRRSAEPEPSVTLVTPAPAEATPAPEAAPDAYADST